MSDQVEGLAREGLGRAQNATGAVLGDSVMQAKGKLNEAAGTAQRRFGEAKDQVRGAVDDARDAGFDRFSELDGYLREQPFVGLAIGAGLGFVLAAFLMGGRKTIYVNTPPKR